MDEMPDLGGDVTDRASKLPDDAGTPTASPGSAFFSTGIENLDRKLGGGFPAGALIVIEAPAGSAGEEFAHEFARTDAHSTLYLSLARPQSLVEADLERNGSLSGNSVVYMGDELEMDGGWLMELAEYQDDWLSHSIVVDPYTEYALAFPEDEAALRELAVGVREAAGVLCLLVHPGATPREARISRQVKHLADVVFEYRPGDSSDPTDELAIPKHRQREETSLELPAVMELDMTEELTLSGDRTF